MRFHASCSANVCVAFIIPASKANAAAYTGHASELACMSDKNYAEMSTASCITQTIINDDKVTPLSTKNDATKSLDKDEHLQSFFATCELLITKRKK